MINPVCPNDTRTTAYIKSDAILRQHKYSNIEHYILNIMENASSLDIFRFRGPSTLPDTNIFSEECTKL